LEDDQITTEVTQAIDFHHTLLGQKAACRWISKLRILATDISTRVLAKSERAVYEAERFSGIPEQWWKKYLLRGRGSCEGF